MRAYSLEFRREVLADCDSGLSTLAVAIKRRVSEAWVRRLKQRRRDNGDFSARPPIKKTEPKWRAYTDKLHRILAARPDITLRELRVELKTDLSLQTLSVALRTLKYTLKKKSCMPRSRTAKTLRSGVRSGG